MSQKKRRTIRRHAQRYKSRTIAEQRLYRQVLSRVCKIEKECPNLGAVVEEFVQKGNVGADAWRRTGALTFDGNVKLPQKVFFFQCSTKTEPPDEMAAHLQLHPLQYNLQTCFCQ